MFSLLMNSKAFFSRVAFCLFLFVSITAHGATRSLTIITNGSGSIAANPSNPVYPENSVVTITATPSPGWQFSGWSGSISGSTNPTNVLMDTDKTITGNFSQIPSYTLSVSVSGGGSVSPSGGTFLSGTSVQLTATASNGWLFHHWSGDIAGSANPYSLMMNANKSVTAMFVQPVAITGQPQNVSVPEQGTANFSITASGTAPISYAWRFNGMPITGATASSLEITNVQPLNGGAYDVVVSNPYSSRTSTVAFLSVSCVGTNVVSVPTEAALRAAVAVGGNIRLCFNGTVTLTDAITVTKNVSLDARGVSVVISGGAVQRLFVVNNGVTFNATNLALIDGVTTNGGAAIRSIGGRVTLVDCVVSNHMATNVSGGAIFCDEGTFTALNSRFVNNLVRGTTTNTLAFFTAQGAALHARQASVQFSDSLLSSNVLVGDIQDNAVPAQLNGGAISLIMSTSAFMRVTFSSNASLGGYARNAPLPWVSGGAIYSRGKLQVKDCTFFGNTAVGNGGDTMTRGEAAGGAIDSDDSGFIVGTTFAGNTARGGRARGTIQGNYRGAPGYGGALRIGAFLSITNCTFTLNAAYGGDGSWFAAPYGEARGGAISVIAGSPMLMNVTLASNSVNVPAPSGTSVPSFGMNIDATTNVSVILRNSLLVGTSNNAWGQVIDGGYNMSSDGSANFSSGTSFNFTNPKLLPLANNGGPTLTMALAADSPAIDWVPAALAPSTDQRGVHRPYGSASDVGAFELGAPAPSLVVLRSGGSVKILFGVVTGSNYRVQHSLNLGDAWETVQTTGISTSNGVWTAMFPVSQPAEYYRVMVDL
jgi:hypothetical protein